MHIIQKLHVNRETFRNTRQERYVTNYKAVRYDDMMLRRLSRLIYTHQLLKDQQNLQVCPILMIFVLTTIPTVDGRILYLVTRR